MDRRWILRLAPPVAGAIVLSAIAGGSLGVSDQPWSAPPCASAAAVAAAVRAAPPDGLRDAVEAGWFTLDARVDRTGELAGQRLRIGVGRSRSRYVDLPAESSASGPFGSVVLAVEDDGERSVVRAWDSAAGCTWTVGTSADVVRRATFDVAGTAVYEFRVRRNDRADLGVWRRPVDGSRPARVLDPPVADARIGPTFVTTLDWTAEGDRLVVESCGAARCRARLLDPVSGAVTALPGGSHGPAGELVGIVGGRAIRFEPCRGLPCGLESTAIESGESRMLAVDARLATVVRTPGGARIAVETGGAGTIAVFRPDGSLERTVATGDPGLRLMPRVDRAAAGVVAPPGWIVLAPDGRSPERAVLIRLADNKIVALTEVTR